VLYRKERAEFAAEYRRQSAAYKAGLRVDVVQPAALPTLEHRFHFVVAGSAGGRVRSAARLVATAAMRSGWWSAQRDDYPITVKTGPSVSEVIVSPEEVNYSGVDRPDVLVIVSEEGLAKSAPFFEAMVGEDTVFLTAGLAHPDTAARVLTVDIAGSDKPVPKASRALAMVAHAVDRTGVVPFDLFEAAAGEGAFGEKNLDLLAAGVALAESAG
jgi:Pyruvate/2-oxoacid:ferredoxin oxidoreductase gamma subunit